MIKRTLLLLTIAALATYAPAQLVFMYGNAAIPQAQTETLFNSPRPGTSRIKFDFILSAGNRMMLEFNSIAQLDNLPDMDSLLRKVWGDLQNFSDSMSDPLASRRVDYYESPTDTRIRILNYPQRSDVYRIKDKEITQLKVEQDTLRIRLFSRGGRTFIGRDMNMIVYYYINIILNNMNELPAVISSAKCSDAILLLKNDVANKVNQKKAKHWYDRYYGLYDMTQNRRVVPQRPFSMVNYGVKSITLPPYFQAGIQYLRGAWVGSLGVGLDLVNHISEGQEQHYYLLWEPYFFFSRSSAGKAVMDKNSFITLKYNYVVHSGRADHTLDFSKGFSIGYLVKRRGDWFEPATFKVAVSGLQTKNLLLEPEFYFNRFFKGVSPSLKLSLYLE